MEGFKKYLNEEAPKLSKEQIEKYKKKMVKNGTPARFLYNGQNLNIVTGETLKKGINVMHQLVYWNFDKATAKEIAKELGVKVEF
jgi:hypothetical protein